MRAKLAFLHASPAAIPPIAEYYRTHAPELDLVHLLDDGLMGCFQREDHDAVERRLGELLDYALQHEAPRMALLSCSAARRDLAGKLAARRGIPVLKIDELLARKAVAVGSRLGLVVSFPPSRPIVENLLRAAAAEQDRNVDLRTVLVAEASAALLAGDAAGHDELLLAAVETLRREACDVIVLGQVSMARLLSKLTGRQGPPVLCSLPLSLEAVRAALGRAG